MLKMRITFGEITSRTLCKFEQQIGSSNMPSSSIVIYYNNYILIINSSAYRVTVLTKTTPYPRQHYRLRDFDVSIAV